MDISIAAEKLFSLFGFPVTNAFFWTIAVSLTLSLIALFSRSKFQDIPRGFQNIVEAVFESLLALVDSVMKDRVQTARFFPLIATLFLFVLFSNWLGLLPGMGTIGMKADHGGEATLIPFLRSGSADLNTTIALSLIVVFTIQAAGIIALGLRGYAKKFFISPFHKPYVIGTFVGLLELLGEATKILSFSFRLFGNIFAGEVLLTVMLHLVPYVLPLPFLLFEIFVGFIQAFVFAMLTLVFLKMAMLPHEEHAS